MWHEVSLLPTIRRRPQESDTKFLLMFWSILECRYMQLCDRAVFNIILLNAKEVPGRRQTNGNSFKCSPVVVLLCVQCIHTVCMYWPLFSFYTMVSFRAYCEYTHESTRFEWPPLPLLAATVRINGQQGLRNRCMCMLLWSAQNLLRFLSSLRR